MHSTVVLPNQLAVVPSPIPHRSPLCFHNESTPNMNFLNSLATSRSQTTGASTCVQFSSVSMNFGQIDDLLQRQSTIIFPSPGIGRPSAFVTSTLETVQHIRYAGGSTDDDFAADGFSKEFTAKRDFGTTKKMTTEHNRRQVRETHFSLKNKRARNHSNELF